MNETIDHLVAAALEEDAGEGDLTTLATVLPDQRCGVRLLAKQPGVLSGMAVFEATFRLLDREIQDWVAAQDGARVEQGVILASFTGQARAVLTAERTAMNFLQHLSGVATITAAFVNAVSGLQCKICDTRKTTPLLRDLEKKAVCDGGGVNHRHGLHDGILIKENHVAAAGGIKIAVRRAREAAHHLLRIEVEVRDLRELELALAAGADVILLDNMDLESTREAVSIAHKQHVLVEASGNMTLERVRAVAETGVDFISVGALTHSAPVLDLSLLIEAL